MSRAKNHYEVLQVDVAADAEVISWLHRKLAQRYHSDRDPSPEARQKMLAVNLAWDVLKDPAKRAAYDAELAVRGDRRGSDRFVRAGGEAGYGEAGPPPRGSQSGSVIGFGRYKGWSLDQIVRHDRDYLEWLERMPAGRQYRDEIALLLRRTSR